MTEKFEIFEAQIKNWGFWGTARESLRCKKDMPKLWKETSVILQKNADLTPEQTRELLDSRWGRHFADRYCEELRTNVQTFIETVDHVITRDRIIKDYRYYVDDKAFPEHKPNPYEGFSEELTKLCKKYKVCLQVVGGVRLCSADEIKDLAGYTSDLESGDLLPIWHRD